MELVMKRDIGRYKAGTVHDWPITTWRHLAEVAGFRLDQIAESVSDALAAKSKRRRK